MAWYEDAKDGNIDARDDDGCCDFEFGRSRFPFCDDGNPVDNDLHQKLHFERVENQDEEEKGWTVCIVSTLYVLLSTPQQFVTTVAIAVPHVVDSSGKNRGAVEERW